MASFKVRFSTSEIGGLRIACKVMIEGYVLLKDHNHVFNRGLQLKSSGSLLPLPDAKLLGEDASRDPNTSKVVSVSKRGRAFFPMRDTIFAPITI